VAAQEDNGKLGKGGPARRASQVSSGEGVLMEGGASTAINPNLVARVRELHKCRTYRDLCE
jgi:hypothetical protein